MKLPKVVVLLLIVISIFTTGCETNTESPENLLNNNIIYDKNKNELYTFVNKSLDGTTLILPQNSSEVGQINELDSNIIAFQKKEDVNLNSNEVGFVIISKNDKGYILKDSYLEEGDEIEYANFYDLNHDGLDEVILLIKNNSSVTMNIYSIKNDKIEKISQVKPTWLDGYEKYTDMKIKIGLINDDLILDILMLNSDSSGDIYATVLNYDKNNKLNISNSIKMSNVKNLSESYMTLGKVYNNKNVKLVIGGDGSQKEWLKGIAKENGVEPQVLFTGALSREEVASWMNKCDVFVLPSRYETFGVVYIEALASGKPVIATFNGGAEDIINEEVGVLVEIDNVNKLAQAMEKVRENYNKYNPESLRNYCTEKFSANVIIKKIINVYKKVIR